MFRQQQGGGSGSVHSTPVAVSLRELLAGTGLSRPTVVSAIRESSEALRSLRYTAGNYKNDRAYSYAVNFVQFLNWTGS